MALAGRPRRNEEAGAAGSRTHTQHRLIRQIVALPPPSAGHFVREQLNDRLFVYGSLDCLARHPPFRTRHSGIAGTPANCLSADFENDESFVVVGFRNERIEEDVSMSSVKVSRRGRHKEYRLRPDPCSAMRQFGERQRRLASRRVQAAGCSP